MSPDVSPVPPSGRPPVLPARYRHRRHRRPDNPWRRARIGVAAFAAVLVGGTLAYRLLGLSWIDAGYQTLITVTTVGFGEVGGPPTPTYRLVTAGVILVGVGTAISTIGLTFEALMEGRLTDYMGRMRMESDLRALRGHVIVCGWGQVGRAIAADVTGRGQGCVVIDRRPDLFEHYDGLGVIGEATDDATLVAAGIERARALVVALDGEADNLFVTLSARALNPGLLIITRAVGPTSERKLLQAGADKVVNPHQIGAQRMASFIIEPHVADFLGETVHDRGFDLRLGEVPVTAGSNLAGRTMEESGFLAATGLTLLAVRRTNQSFLRSPGPGYAPAVGDVLIVLGSADEHQAARVWPATVPPRGAAS